MAGAKRIRKIKMDLQGAAATRVMQEAIRRAMKKIAAEMHKDIYKSIDHQTGLNGPSSPPGGPPYKRTGFLQAHTSVKYEARDIVARTPQYGIYLEGGTSKMEARPFIRPELFDKRPYWGRRLQAEVSRELRMLERARRKARKR